ncbi:hypothetical protein XFEB_00384 [Xylella fastidiosa EB92.1]|nr:hypothetical protein XFEB_00384 [Xylella fastidiosa EB92.1]
MQQGNTSSCPKHSNRPPPPYPCDQPPKTHTLLRDHRSHHRHNHIRYPQSPYDCPPKKRIKPDTKKITHPKQNTSNLLKKD